MAQATISTYQEDEVIVKQGDPDKSLYKIISGKVALYMNYAQENEYLMGIQTFPSCFGEMTILSGKPSLYTVVAITETKILRVPEDNFETFIQNNTVNAIAIMKTMAKNISLLNMNIKMLTEEISYMSEQVGEKSEQVQALFDKLDTNSEDKEVASVIKNDKNFSIYLKGHKDHPEIKCMTQKKYTYLKEFVCPHCGTKFISACFNKASVDEKDLKKYNEYETRYDCESFRVEWYQIITCSHCYFSAFTDMFQKSDTILLRSEKYEDDLKRAFSSLFLNFSETRTLDFVFAQYYLALICAKGITDRKQVHARIWLNLSRLYEDVGERELANEAGRQAAEAFKKYHIESDLTTKLEHRICINIAGRLYAAGDIKEAKELAVLVRTDREDQTCYTRVAEDMIVDMRDKSNRQ